MWIVIQESSALQAHPGAILQLKFEEPDVYTGI